MGCKHFSRNRNTSVLKCDVTSAEKTDKELEQNIRESQDRIVGRITTEEKPSSPSGVERATV